LAELGRDQHSNRTALVRRARAQLAAWFHGWNDDEWDERMKRRDIATGKFTLFRAKWTMTSKRGASRYAAKSRTHRRFWERFDKLWR
jgi:hypothetical protein